MADKSKVEIGYVEKSESWKLESRYFPSKIGGKPAWLDLKNISIDLSCGNCSKQCVFLCQIYAPFDDREHSYHRTIFIFVCKDPECCKLNDNSNFKVYRCQLSKVNEYYPPEEPRDDPQWCPEITITKYKKPCVVCGCHAPHQCGNCKVLKYCSKEHQLLDWKSGHNVNCSKNEETKCNVLFPEFELMTEPEIIDEDEEPQTSEKSEAEKLKEYEELLKKGKAGTLQDVPVNVMEQLALGKQDKYFKNYKKRLEICPDQVLRYEKNGEPLWISKPNITNSDVPLCEYCNGSRQFEFQILSTLLNYLNVDSLDKSLDWGTLVIYTCANSCNEGPEYKKEFLYKQDII